MAIAIFQRGGDKSKHNLLLDAADFVASQLMSTRMKNSLNIRLEMRSSKLDKDVMGVCTSSAMGSKANKDFTITIRRDDSLFNQLETLAHELVHVWQISNNTMQSRRWKSDGKMHMRWAGKDAGMVGELEYKDMPWEIEAFGLEGNLRDAYIHKHNGHQDKLDSELSNIRDKVSGFLLDRESFPFQDGADFKSKLQAAIDNSAVQEVATKPSPPKSQPKRPHPVG